MPEGLPESAYSSAGLNAGDLQLALILRSAVKDAIGHIEGTFEVQAGEMREQAISIAASSKGKIDASELGDSSIEIQAVASSEVSIQLTGATIDKIAEVRLINAGKTLRPTQSTRSSGGNSNRKTMGRGWKVEGTLAKDATIEVWKESDNKPAWNIPIGDSLGEIRNDSLNIHGQLGTSRLMEATVYGPKTALLRAQFVDDDGRLSNQDSSRKDLGPNHTLSVKSNFTGSEPIALNLLLCDGAVKSAVLFSFDDVTINSTLVP